MIQAAIFDMDGVLTDSESLICKAAMAMFSEMGHEVRPEDFIPFVGAGENRYIGGVAEAYGIELDLPAAKKRTYEFYLDLVPEDLQAFPGAAAFVHACVDAGLKIAVASSADRVKVTANLLKIELPPDMWGVVLTGEDVERRKPEPDIFLAAAERLGVPPADCVVIEDAVHGVEAAKAAGMRCVAVTTSFTAEELGPADLVRPAIADLSVADLTAA